MSQKIPLQDSASDPRNEDDYDTWEYGTEPVPGDHTWKNKKLLEEYQKIWNEMDSIEPLTPLDEETKKSYESFKDAAASDDYMFGDYNSYDVYKKTE